MIIAPRGLYCFDDRSGNIIITKGYRVRTDFSGDSTDQSVMYVNGYPEDSISYREGERCDYFWPAGRQKHGRQGIPVRLYHQ